MSSSVIHENTVDCIMNKETAINRIRFLRKASPMPSLKDGLVFAIRIGVIGAFIVGVIGCALHVNSVGSSFAGGFGIGFALGAVYYGLSLKRLKENHDEAIKEEHALKAQWVIAEEEIS